jgi:hypothetical protein
VITRVKVWLFGRPSGGPNTSSRPLGGLSDSDLQQRALSVATDREACVTESLFRTRDALLLSQQTTNDLTEGIKTLTVWLVFLTVAIAVLTVVMAWPALLALWPKGAGR